VYTPADHIIGRGGQYKIDLNHDGHTDYVIIEHPGIIDFKSYQRLFVKVAEGNRVLCSTKFCISTYIYAAALGQGFQIGPNEPGNGWLAHSGPMAIEEMSKRGSVFYTWPWVNVTNRYLGLRFQINGENHFGWARLTVKFHPGLPQDRTWEAHLTGFAYETVPGKAIKAGQTTEETGDATESTHPGLMVPSSVVGQPLSRPAQFASLGTLALGADGISAWRREESESDGRTL
jgi:hypothetical protein